MSKKSGLTLAMLIIYIIVLTIIMGAVVVNFSNNNQIEQLDKATYQAKIMDYIEEFTTMKKYYTLKGEFSSNTTMRGNEKDINNRTILDYITSITREDMEYLCIYRGELHFYGINENDSRYQYLTESGLTIVQPVTTKIQYNAAWIKIFSHEPNGGNTLFNSDPTIAEYLSCNTTGKYSILNKLEDFRDKDDNFEFLLQYNNLSEYNRWKQSSNPVTALTESSDGSAVPGYRAISLSWTGAYFNGLVKSSSSSTFLDCSTNHGNWWYAIGAFVKYGDSIPGYSGNSNISLVELWVRIDNS